MEIEEIQLEVFKLTRQSIDANDPFFIALAMLSATATGIEINNLAALAEMRLMCDELKKKDEAIKIDENVFIENLKIFGRIALRIEKNAKRYSLLTYSAATAGLVAAFGGGVLFSSVAISSSWLIGGVLGTIVGSALTFFAINQIKNKYGEVVSIPVQKNSFQEPTNVWTEKEFVRVLQSLEITISDRTSSACFDVLVNKKEINEVADIYKVFPGQIMRCLSSLRSKR